MLELANTDLCEGSSAPELDAEQPDADADLFLGEEFEAGRVRGEGFCDFMCIPRFGLIGMIPLIIPLNYP